jgi:hypothetical protein
MQSTEVLLSTPPPLPFSPVPLYPIPSSPLLSFIASNTRLYSSNTACNAAETLLLHESTVESGLADKILRALRIAGVTLYG